MKKILRKIVFKWLAVLAGVLLIASAFQFLVYMRGVDLLVLSVTSMPGPQSKNFNEELKQDFYKKLGWSKLFIPDLWPFDNESLWR